MHMVQKYGEYTIEMKTQLGEKDTITKNPYTLFFLHKNNFIRTRLKFAQKLRTS